MLEADGIQLAFDRRTVLSDIYLQSVTGEITGLLGRNGAGKSCLLQIMYGVLEAEGSVRINKQPVFAAYRQPALIRYLPQFNFIPGTLSLKKVFDNFAIDYAAFYTQFVEFEGRHTAKINRLSGGERRLIELYVVVKADSLFVLLDEPFTHLTPAQVEKVQQLLVEEKSTKGIIITDHMYKQVADISNRLYVLTDGKTQPAISLADIEKLGYAKQ